MRCRLSSVMSRFALEILQSFYYRFNMTFDLDRSPQVRDISFWVDQEGGSHRPENLPSVHLLLGPAAINLHDLVVGVAEELESQAMFLGEFPMACG